MQCCLAGPVASSILSVRLFSHTQPCWCVFIFSSLEEGEAAGLLALRALLRHSGGGFAAALLWRRAARTVGPLGTEGSEFKLVSERGEYESMGSGGGASSLRTPYGSTPRSGRTFSDHAPHLADWEVDADSIKCERGPTPAAPAGSCMTLCPVPAQTRCKVALLAGATPRIWRSCSPFFCRFTAGLFAFLLLRNPPCSAGHPAQPSDVWSLLLGGTASPLDASTSPAVPPDHLLCAGSAAAQTAASGCWGRATLGGW
jgi:hypothetical protein